MEYFIQIPLLYLIINAIYYFIFSVASKARLQPKGNTGNDKKNRIAVLIPAYKEDAVIVETACKAAHHNYPKDKFDVYVISDQLQAATLMKLNKMDVCVLEVSFVQSSKTKAINAALERIDAYDITVVLDADNVMKLHFLTEINKAYNQGALAMQGQRIAKNAENNLARLDAISEGINNNIFRQGHQNLGLSSALIGSGMAFDFQLFRMHMSPITALGGFDKDLELSLLMSKIKIHYLPNALVYDEKVSDKTSFANQRTRWIAAQIRVGGRFFWRGIVQLFRARNIDYFDKVLQFVLLPRLMLLGCLVLMAAVSWVVSKGLFLVTLSFLVICGLALLIATPTQYLGRRTFRLLFSLPIIFFQMILAIGGYKKATNSFLHTTHKTKVISCE